MKWVFGHPHKQLGRDHLEELVATPKGNESFPPNWVRGTYFNPVYKEDTSFF
jgi:hypothetical protein